MKSAAKQFQSAFTLIEVLIALMIVAIALLGIVKASHTTLISQAYLEDKTEGSWLANNILAEIQLGLLVAPISNKPLILLNRTYYSNARIESTSDTNVSKIIISIFNSEHQNVFNLEGFKEKE